MGSMLNYVITTNRKDDKVSLENTKKTSQNVIKSAAWLVEACFRLGVGYVLINNFDHLATTVAAFYMLGTGTVIVILHFVRANK